MRVSSYIALLVCLCGLVTPVHADTTQARILLGASEASLSPAPVYDGSRVLAPLCLLADLGVSYAKSTTGDSITATTASGQTGDIKTVDLNGQPMIPMDKLIALVGGEQSWDAKTHTLTLLAHVDSAEFDNDTLKINCSYPVRAQAKSWNGKIIVDIVGAKVASEAREVYIGGPVAARARLGQLDATTARVVLDINKATSYELQTTDPAAQIQLKIGDNLAAPTSSNPPPASSQPNAPGCAIKGVAVTGADDHSADVTINTSGRANASRDYSVSPPRIVLGIPARIDSNCQVTGSSPLVSCEIAPTASGTKLILKLVRPMDYSVESKGDSLVVHVRPLDKSGGTLAGKLIVIDPGHGGNQKGACAGGVMEKDVNMQLARSLAAVLQKQGAKPILTREGDQVMGLAERAQVAIDRGADFFIALHCNSNLAPNSSTGIETYYHSQEPSPKTLACFVHDGICKTTGMCDRRARSDLSLYGLGLGVLRSLSGSGIPGILVECGYINNSSDRAKLCDSAYRNKLAGGIVAGLKEYVEGPAGE